MKRKVIFLIGTLFIMGIFATAAMAASFNVTANYGVRVAEKGSCERVGSVTLAPATGTWTAGTVITAEYLAGAVLCDDVDYAEGSYTIAGTKGDDFLTITIGGADYGGDIVLGDDNSPVCLVLTDTPYNSTDPNYQLVQVSYRDDQSNTYSGDTYVATVKPQNHDITVCTKAEEDNFESGLYNWPSVIGKDGLPEIPLCYSASQEQESCGTDEASVPACVKIADAGNQIVAGQYDFTLSFDKLGVGIRDVVVYDKDGAPLTTTIDDRYAAADAEDPISDWPASPTGDDYVKVKKVTFHADMTGPGDAHVIVYFAYDSCTATPGILNATLSFNQDPCGDSFSKALDIANFTSCGGGPSSGVCFQFPYAPKFTAGWWVGLALTNWGDSEITVSLDIREADGDQYTKDVTVPAHGMFVDTADNLNPTTTSADAQFGDERFSVRATSASYFGGFIMFGDGAQAQGYVPDPCWRGMPW